MLTENSRYSCALLALFAVNLAWAEVPSSSPQEDVLSQVVQQGTIAEKVKRSPAAEEMKELLGLQPVIARLSELSSTEMASTSPEALRLREHITESVVMAFLDVDGMLAEIDSEVAQMSELRAYMEARRDRKIAIGNVANIVMGGGVGVVGQLLQINHSTAGSIVGAVAGGVSTVLAGAAMRQQRGESRPLGIAPNMLAMIFNRQPEFHSDYPELVWRYLDKAVPVESDKGKRRERLIDHWVQMGRIASPSEKSDRKIDLLTSSVSAQHPLSIDVLLDRTMMLLDLRAQVSIIKRDLARLMTVLLTR